MKTQFIKWLFKRIVNGILHFPKQLCQGVCSIHSSVARAIVNDHSLYIALIFVWALVVLCISITVGSIMHLPDTQAIAFIGNSYLLSLIYLVPMLVYIQYWQFINELEETANMLKD